MIKETSGVIMKLLILLFLTNIAHATYDPSLQNLQLDMMYSAKVSSAGVVSEESKDFINGNCVASGTGSATFTCTFNTGIFTVTPNCVAASSTQGWAATVSTSTTASQAVVQTEYIVTPAPNADSFKVACQKQGVDYLTASSAVYSVQNQNTDMTSYSPNVSSPGILTNSGKWRRVGDMMEIEAYIEWNGSGGGGTLLVDIPSGYTIDTAKIAYATSSRLGGGQWLDTGTAYYDVSVVYADTNSVRFMQTGGTAYLDGSAFTSGDQMKFNIMVPITGWKTAPFAIAAIAGYGQTPGVVGSANQAVDTFTVSYGTTNASTACTASPCSFLDQIGTAVTSITRTGTGAYTINLPRTYAKIKCVGNANVPGSNVGLFQNAPLLQCSSCSTLSFYTLNVSLAAADTNGTIICQGNY